MTTAYTIDDGNGYFPLAQEQFSKMITLLSSEESHKQEHGEIEALVKKEGTELLRRLVQEHLDLRCRLEERHDVVGEADNVKRTHCREECERNLMTLFGEVVVRRKGYSARGASSVFLLDEVLNLPGDKYSQGLREHIAYTVSKMSFDETVAGIERDTGGKVPKLQVERIAVALSQDFESYYEQSPEGPETTQDLLIMTTDGKGIVMRPEALQEGTRKAAARAKPKLKTRLCRGEKSNRKRMATVAAIYTIAPHVRQAEDILGPKPVNGMPLVRPAPESKQVWASLEKDMAPVIDDLFQEALRRDPERKRKWIMLVDGQESQLRQIEAASERHGAKVTIVQDFIHVLEYLWKAAYCFHPEGSEEAEKWVQERGMNILRGKASDVAAGMRRSATRRNLSQQVRKPVDKCAAYIQKNQVRLAYDKALAEGLPIATGIIEGACRYLIKDRMDITGARWSLKGAEAILKLRSLAISGDLAGYLLFHRSQERTRNYPAQLDDCLQDAA